MGVLTGKTVVVTGAGRGIGRAIARASAQAGGGVVVADYGVELDGRDPSTEVAERVVAEITAAGGAAVAVAESVTTLEGARRIVRAGIEAFGAVDGAVCCAGILRHRPFVEMSEDDFSLVVDTHLKGHFNVFCALAEHVVAACRHGVDGSDLLGLRERRPDPGQLSSGQGGHRRPHEERCPVW